MHYFDGDTWKYNALMDYASFKELNDFILNDAAADAHSNSYHIIGDPVSFSKSQIEEIKNHKIEALRDALTNLSSQTIISLCITFEVCAREFLRALFVIKPATMFDYLGTEDAKGYVSLKEIIQTASHSELIAKLADKASSVASKGKYGDVYSRALSICGQSVESGLKAELNTLQVERNKYIHERQKLNAGINEVSKVHMLIDTAIEGLCNLGAIHGVPGSYTCVRPETFVEIKDIALMVKKEL